MAEKTVFQERVGAITERFIMDGDTVHVHRTEDCQSVIDAVALANSHGTTEIDGLGRLVAEVPLTLAQSFCDDRGIPWARFMYGNEYDAEFKRFLAAHRKLLYARPVQKTAAH